MSDGVISKIQLPSGAVYDIVGSSEGTVAEVDSTYDSNTKTVTIFANTLVNADSTEY